MVGLARRRRVGTAAPRPRRSRSWRPGRPSSRSGFADGSRRLFVGALDRPEPPAAPRPPVARRHVRRELPAPGPDARARAARSRPSPIEPDDAGRPERPAGPGPGDGPGRRPAPPLPVVLRRVGSRARRRPSRRGSPGLRGTSVTPSSGRASSPSRPSSRRSSRRPRDGASSAAPCCTASSDPACGSVYLAVARRAGPPRARDGPARRGRSPSPRSSSASGRARKSDALLVESLRLLGRTDTAASFLGSLPRDREATPPVLAVRALLARDRKDPVRAARFAEAAAPWFPGTPLASVAAKPAAWPATYAAFTRREEARVEPRPSRRRPGALTRVRTPAGPKVTVPARRPRARPRPSEAPRRAALRRLA